MSRRAPAWAAALAFGLCLPGLAPAQPAALPATAPAAAQPGQDLLDAANDYRAAQGRARWLPDATLQAIALRHSQTMARSGVFSHDGFRGRFSASGRRHCVENLASLQPGADIRLVMALWQRSRSHHDNLLDADATHAGIGMVNGFATLLACSAPR